MIQEVLVFSPPPGPALQALVDVTEADLIARGHAVLVRAADDGLDWAEDDIAALQALLDAPNAAAIWRRAYDLRGNGGTFGWPLVTDVATLVCRYVDRQGEHADARTLQALTGALLVVFTEGLKGDAGEAGRELIAALQRLPGVPKSVAGWAAAF